MNVLKQLDKSSNETAGATYFHQKALTEVRAQLQQSNVIVNDELLGTVAGFLLYAVWVHLKAMSPY